MNGKQRERLWDAIGYASAATLVGIVGWVTFFYNPKDDQERIPKRPLPQVYSQQTKPAQYAPPAPRPEPFVLNNGRINPNLAILVGDQADASYVGEDMFDIRRLMEQYGLTRDRVIPDAERALGER